MGIKLNVDFPPLNTGLIEKSRSHFKQSISSTLIPLLYVLGCFINFWVIFGYIWEEIVFLKGEIKNVVGCCGVGVNCLVEFQKQIRDVIPDNWKLRFEMKKVQTLLFVGLR